MPPALLELCVNVVLSVLRAENKLKFRTMVILATTLLNAAITIIGTYFWNYYAAAIGTALSFLLGSVIVMNIYYKKVFHFPMLKIYRKIFGKVWICLILAAVAAYAATLLTVNPIGKMLFGVIAFFAVYGVTMLLFGLNQDEKKYLKMMAPSNMATYKMKTIKRLTLMILLCFQDPVLN